MNNQSWVSRSVCSHLPISPAALCATTALLHTELTQTYLKRSESYDHCTAVTTLHIPLFIQSVFFCEQNRLGVKVLIRE